MANDDLIETPRLRLVALSGACLERLLDGDVDGASRLLACHFSSDFLDSVNDVFLSNHLGGLRRHPSNPGWFVRAIVRRDDDRVIGHCGFHGVPDDVGRAEIGYSIFEEFRRQGFGVESARGLVDWARAQGSSAVYAAVASHNVASLALIRRLGFRPSGARHGAGDEESVFVLELSEQNDATDSRDLRRRTRAPGGPGAGNS